MADFWKSRAVWTVIADIVGSSLLFFGGKYLQPDWFENIKFILVAVQPLVGVILLHFTKEDMIKEVEAHIQSLVR